MTLIDFCNKYMLIDCDITSTDDEAYKYIDNIIIRRDGATKKKIDYIVVTHPHKDHISGLNIIDDNYDIGEIWESGYRFPADEEGCTEYEEFLDLIERIDSKKLKAGNAEIPSSLDGIKIHCLCSKSNDNDSEHYNSLVLKISEGSKSIVFAKSSYNM